MTKPRCYGIISQYSIRGCCSMVEFQPSKLAAWVRFPSPAPEKKHLLSTDKRCFFSYPSRRLGISSRVSVYIIAVGVYHHRRCILLRLDEMQHFVLMICNSFGIDEIQGFALICMQKSDIICSKNKNLNSKIF